MDNVKVEQRDREAYHRLAAIENSNVPFWASTEGAWLLSGDADNTPQIQAFARHRLAELAWRQPMSNDEDFEDAMALYEATANAGSRHHLAERDHMAPAPGGEVDCAGLVEELIAADYEWHGPFGREKWRWVKPDLFDLILAALRASTDATRVEKDIT